MRASKGGIWNMLNAPTSARDFVGLAKDCLRDDSHLEARIEPATSDAPGPKSAKAEAVLKQRGAWFLCLPPYSPGLNPIEMAFARLKAHLRRIGARTIDALWRAIGDICVLYSEQECWNDLKDAGYGPD